jgi:hypothetical protein
MHGKAKQSEAEQGKARKIRQSNLKLAKQSNAQQCNAGKAG